MTPPTRLSRARLFALLSMVVVLTAASDGRSRAAGPAGAAGWERKLDPFLRRLALGTRRTEGRFGETIPGRSQEAARTLPSFVQVTRSGTPVAHVKAGLRDDAQTGGRGWKALRPALAQLGIEIRGQVGPYASLAVPADAIEGLASLDEIAWLKTAHAYHLRNDVSTSSAHVGSDQANATFTRGAGVIVAVVDTGIQWTDHDVRNADGTTRLLGIWDQTLDDPAHPPPAGFSFGAWYPKADIDAALAASGTLLTGDGHGHGTHVSGTSAGNGLETGNGIAPGTFAGIAPEADILLVRVFDDIGTFCDACDLTAAVEFIQDTAAAAGEPWVGNMSLGTDIGAHDGTDPDERTIDTAVGPGTHGAQMAIAAGNSGGRDRSPHAMHWEGALPAVGTSITNTFTLSYSALSGNDNDFVWLDVWYKGADNVKVEMISPGAFVIGANRGVDSGVVCTTDGAIQVDATNSPDPINGDNEAFIQLWDSGTCASPAPPRNGTWTIRLTTNAIASSAPTFDLWNEATVSPGFASLTTFVLGKSIGIPGTARQAITAGSYVSKDRWINSGNTQTVAQLSTLTGVGSLSGFSSLGPTRDGRIKPDVAAPGEYVGSSLAGSIEATRGTAFTERDGKHGDIRGTSMATPHVAGTAALLFGINPNLSGPEVKAAIQASARSDSFTVTPGPLPNNYYGAGKLRALEAGYQAASMVIDLGATSPSTFNGTDSPFMDSYNVYRGTVPGLSATSHGTCFLSGLPSPAFNDAAGPAAGQAFFYLVTGVHAGVEGIMGIDSAGRIEVNSSPCP